MKIEMYVGYSPVFENIKKKAMVHGIINLSNEDKPIERMEVIIDAKLNDSGNAKRLILDLETLKQILEDINSFIKQKGNKHVTY